MKRLLLFAWLAALPAMAIPQAALAQRAQYETLIATHSKANMVPEVLVHRIIVRESKYQASLLGRGGTIGLMQIKLATARALGYSGDAEGLRDPDTNLKYGVRYLAGAYRAAGGDHDRAVKYFAAGYYPVAKQQRLDHLQQAKAGATATPPKPLPADQIAAVKDAPAAKDAPAPKDASDAAPEAAPK